MTIGKDYHTCQSCGMLIKPNSEHKCLPLRNLLEDFERTSPLLYKIPNSSPWYEEGVQHAVDFEKQALEGFQAQMNEFFQREWLVESNSQRKVPVPADKVLEELILGEAIVIEWVGAGYKVETQRGPMIRPDEEKTFELACMHWPENQSESNLPDRMTYHFRKIRGLIGGRDVDAYELYEVS